KDCLCLIDSPPAKVGVQPIAIPELCEHPCLLKCERLATLAMLPPPRLRAFFRPEEQDIRSGVNQIVVPMAKWQAEIDGAFAINAVIHDVQPRGLVGIGVGGLYLRVRMQRSRNAEHIPRTVSVISMCFDMNLERRRERGEGMRHTHIERSRLQKERVPAM